MNKKFIALNPSQPVQDFVCENLLLPKTVNEVYHSTRQVLELYTKYVREKLRVECVGNIELKNNRYIETVLHQNSMIDAMYVSSLITAVGNTGAECIDDAENIIVEFLKLVKIQNLSARSLNSCLHIVFQFFDRIGNSYIQDIDEEDIYRIILEAVEISQNVGEKLERLKILHCGLEYSVQIEDT